MVECYKLFAFPLTDGGVRWMENPCLVLANLQYPIGTVLLQAFGFTILEIGLSLSNCSHNEPIVRIITDSFISRELLPLLYVIAWNWLRNMGACRYFCFMLSRIPENCISSLKLKRIRERSNFIEKITTCYYLFTCCRNNLNIQYYPCVIFYFSDLCWHIWLK